jgi:hypothetical protein
VTPSMTPTPGITLITPPSTPKPSP